MSKVFKKSRFFYLHPATNAGKIARLEALYMEYISYVRICVEQMLSRHKFNLRLSEKQAFFPEAQILTSHIEKNARDHAIQVVSTWSKAVYSRKLKGVITKLKKDGVLSEVQAKSLYTVGKYLCDAPQKNVTQDDIDSYWTLLDEHGGKKPEIRNNTFMRLSEYSAPFKDASRAKLASSWMRLSSLTARKTIALPFLSNPYIDSVSELSKGILARKKNGRWRFEAVETKDWVVPEPQDLPEEAPRLGVDVGLNVLASVSNGDLYGARFKPKFDKLYQKVKRVRANRQRQGLTENSPRLDQLEANLSGAVKSEVGKIANRLVGKHPSTIFVLEDLDLRGCKGQKRFAYRALQKSLETKAPTLKVNPAYTSQECPSCHYVSRLNRSGVKFRCHSCGRKAHADWIGSSNIAGRSWDIEITCQTSPNSVRATLEKRFVKNRYPGSLSQTEPKLKGPNLTTRGSPKDASKGSNKTLGSSSVQTQYGRYKVEQDSENPLLIGSYGSLASAKAMGSMFLSMDLDWANITEIPTKHKKLAKALAGAKTPKEAYLEYMKSVDPEYEAILEKYR